ncbi:MAG: zinc ribbon domain-containing protein [Prevotella sp.]|nr:zinc ribbon domain-containing protein [Prevotella sp.]
MALITCSECGTEMSDKAQNCPKCGAPNPNAAPVQQFAYQPQFNPCARHPQAPAVTTCGNCGSAMCKDCKDLTVYTFDNKPACIDCALMYMEGNIENLKKTKRWSMIKFIVLAIIVLLAVGLWRYKPDDMNNIIAAWIVAAMGGIFSTLSLVKRNEAEKAADDFYTKLNPGDGIANEATGCFGRILGAVLLAPLFTVGYTFKHLIRWISSSRSLRQATDEYEEYTALLRERGELN